MRTITALFVGLGSIGTRHLKNLANLCADRGWTLQADALRSDLTRPLRPGAAELLHAQYTDLTAAPAHYDMVFITNPTSLHAEALRQVKGRGDLTHSVHGTGIDNRNEVIHTGFTSHSSMISSSPYCSRAISGTVRRL